MPSLTCPASSPAPMWPAPLAAQAAQESQGRVKGSGSSGRLGMKNLRIYMDFITFTSYAPVDICIHHHFDVFFFSQISSSFWVLTFACQEWLLHYGHIGLKVYQLPNNIWWISCGYLKKSHHLPVSHWPGETLLAAQAAQIHGAAAAKAVMD